MNNYLLFLGLLSIGLLYGCGAEKTNESNLTSTFQQMDMKAPQAKQVAKELTIHGDTRIDPYYWLNQREDPEVIAYLTAENDYKDGVMAHTKGFQEKLFQEIKARIKEDDQSVPYKDNGFYYITRYETGKEYPIFSRKKETLEAEEELMLDVNELAAAYDFYSIGGRSVSPNNKLLAYGEDTLSRRIYTLKFKDLETGKMLPDEIPNTVGSCSWSNDNQYVFYTTKEEGTLRAYKIFRHKLGTPGFFRCRDIS